MARTARKSGQYRNPKNHRSFYRNNDRSKWTALEWAQHESRILAHETRIGAELARLGNAADQESDDDDQDD